MRIFYIVTLLFISAMVWAQQPYGDVLNQIAENNLYLKTARKEVEAQKMGNRTGNFLPNPELGFNYLNGSPGEIGNRTDINVTQSFDFPGAYVQRNKLMKKKDALAELDYREKKLQVMARAVSLCTELVYLSQKEEAIKQRFERISQQAEAYQKAYSAGEINKLELNKAKVTLMGISNELERLKLEKAANMESLNQLNGNIPVDFNNKIYADVSLPASFDEWFNGIKQQHPTMAGNNQQIEVSQTKEKVERQQSMPGFSVGYMSESVTGETFQGVTMGVSIPLFENKNKVKQAKLETQLAQEYAASAESELRSRLQQQYQKALQLQQLHAQNKTMLEAVNSETILQKALENGEISLLQYYLELSATYQAIDITIQTERDYQLALWLLKVNEGN